MVRHQMCSSLFLKSIDEGLEGFLEIQGYWPKIKGIQDIFVNI